MQRKQAIQLLQYLKPLTLLTCFGVKPLVYFPTPLSPPVALHLAEANHQEHFFEFFMWKHSTDFRAKRTVLHTGVTPR